MIFRSVLYWFIAVVLLFLSAKVFLRLVFVRCPVCGAKHSFNRILLDCEMCHAKFDRAGRRTL